MSSTIDPMDHSNVEALLAAYALDAVTDEERRAVDDLLETSEDLRAEVADHLEVAALLGTVPDDPPAAVWDRIADQLDDPISEQVFEREPSANADAHTVQPGAADRPSEVVPMRRSSSPQLGGWRLLAVAAVALALVAVGALVARAVAPTTERDLATEAVTAAAEPGARTWELLGDDDRRLATVVLRADGEGILVADDLPPLDAARTYQLWALAGPDGSVPISLGVLGANPAAAAFTAETPVAGMALSIEARGGAVAPADGPIAVAVAE
ncbi:MAG: anti-sigma factor [Acidimicrobiia bacterium]|nr:anti-sigma factor [Acidimicrobiia bacterium]